MQRDWPALFKGRHFAAEIIILCVRRYLRYALSLRNLKEIMEELEYPGGPRYDLALDSTFRAGTEPALSAGTADNQSVTARRRNLSSSRGQVGLSI